MRIAMVTSRYPYGGAEQVAKLLVEGLSPRHEVSFITTGDEAADHAEDGHRRIVIPLPRLRMFWHHYWNPRVVGALRRHLEKLRPDVVHFHSIANRTFSAQALSVSRDFPTVWSLHDVWSQCVWSASRPADCGAMLHRCFYCAALPVLSAVNRYLKERAFRRADLHVIVPCEWLRARIANSALAAKPVHVIANGVPIARFASGSRERARRALGVPESAVVVLFAGQMMNDWKGYKDLLRVAERMLPEHEDLWFVFVGRRADPPRGRPPLGETRGQRVIFTGAVPYDAMPDYYAAGDVFAYPTHADIQAQVVLEAMASGLPTVLHGVGGLPDLVVEGETGFVVKEFDARTFEERLRRLVTNADRRRAMGAAARERVHGNFTLALQVQRTEEVYAQVVAERRRRT
jgi:glycosyltransferase involved in cell wall biosynthesis